MLATDVCIANRKNIVNLIKWHSNNFNTTTLKQFFCARYVVFVIGNGEEWQWSGYYTTAYHNNLQEYKEWISDDGSKIITSTNTLLFISNPIEAIYAAYATQIKRKSNYAYQFMGIGEGNVMVLSYHQ